MFKASNVYSGYEGVTVLQGLTFDLGHEIYAILGANGAGKSTLMRTASRVLPLMSGKLEFKGEDVSNLPPYELATRGLAYVPQEYNVFPELSVRENLSLGSLIGKRPRQERLEELYELFPDIADRINQKAGSLSGGETKMVALGRALVQDPELILLDEPTAGLSPKYVDNFFQKILDIHQVKGVSVILAEQNAAKTIEIADRVMLLSLGKAFRIADSKDIDVDAVREGYHM
jgi:branched-chain amino acid transport system ATP-binding protein